VLPYSANGNGTADVCGRTETKIIGGSNAKQADFPYQVIIQSDLNSVNCM
jgi:secreted trypsin-like serine protease